MFQHITLLHEKIFWILQLNVGLHIQTSYKAQTSSGDALRSLWQCKVQRGCHVIHSLTFIGKTRKYWTGCMQNESKVTPRIAFLNINIYKVYTFIWYILLWKLCRPFCLGSDSIWRLCWRLITFLFLLIFKVSQ